MTAGWPQSIGEGLAASETVFGGEGKGRCCQSHIGHFLLRTSCADRPRPALRYLGSPRSPLSFQLLCVCGCSAYVHWPRPPGQKSVKKRKGRSWYPRAFPPSLPHPSCLNVAAPKVNLCVLHDKLCLDSVFHLHNEGNGYVENVTR